MEEVDDIEYPETVVDKEAYVKYIRLNKHAILNEKKLHDCSDGTVVNLGKMPHHLQKDIEHLPISEQTEIMKLKQVFFDINNKMNVQKRYAFGLKFGIPAAIENSPIIIDKKEELIEYYGRMFTTDELLKVVVQDWKLPITKSALSSFRKANALEIEKKIEQFKSSYSDIRLGVKRSRLEELVWMYGRAKDKYIASMNREDYKLMLQTLEAIRKEAEGDKLTIDGKIDVNHELDISKHVREEVFKTMNIKEIILGRVAARMNVNPIRLINSLNNSYYAKFSNVVQEMAEDIKYEPIYPSSQNYDFDKIKQLNELAVQKDKENNEIPAVNSSKARNIKEIIKEKLKAKQNALRKVTGEVKSDTEAFNKSSASTVSKIKPKIKKKH